MKESEYIKTRILGCIKDAQGAITNYPSDFREMFEEEDDFATVLGILHKWERRILNKLDIIED